MNKRFALAILFCIGLWLGLATESQARGLVLETKDLAGHDKLYADLNGDGKTEQVGIVGEAHMLRPGLVPVYYRIVVMNNKGKVISRSDIFQFMSYPKYCLLSDIDGDGCQELVFSVEMYDNENVYSQPGYDIFKWKNGEFRGYNRKSYGNFHEAYIEKGSIGATYRVTDDATNGIYNGLYCLRKVNGNLWGDIVIAYYSEDNYDSVPSDIPDDVRVVKNGDRYYLCKTVRLEPFDGGLRIVEYKKF